MKDIHYVLANFFTHKDFLVTAAQIPGTLFTPLHLVFEAVLVALILASALWVSRHKKAIHPVLTGLWIALVVYEVVIIWWDNTAGSPAPFDWQTSLSLYPCSLFLYTLPVILWGRGTAKQAAFGYVFTLGLLGALVNFLYPFTRLQDYSCLSFPAFHTFFFHGSMLFGFLVMLLSGMHGYTGVQKWQELFYPCIPSLLLSVPANLLNYTIGSDYMYFRGQFFLLKNLFGTTPEPVITLALYGLYICIPALFYLPSFLRRAIREEERYELESALPELRFSWLFMG